MEWLALIVLLATAWLWHDNMQAREIAPYKLPERLEIFAELPRTAGGKLSKVTLRSEVVERMAAR